jgi:hypothetical protein
VFTPRDNGAVAAFTIWKRLVHNAGDNAVNSDIAYLKQQKDELYTNMQVHQEILPVMALEEKGIYKESLN